MRRGRPPGIAAACRGDAPFAAGAGERTHVDIAGAAGLVREVRDPAAVRREHRHRLDRRRAQKHRGRAGRPARARHRPPSAGSSGPHAWRRDWRWKARNLPLGCHDDGRLVVRAVGQPRDLARAVGVHPIQVEDAGLGPIGRKHDAPAVGRPDRDRDPDRGRRSIASACPAPTRTPRCRAACRRRCRAPASGRPARTADSPSRLSSRGAPTSCRRASSSRSDCAAVAAAPGTYTSVPSDGHGQLRAAAGPDSRRRPRAPAPPGRSSRGDRDRRAPRRACPAACRSDARLRAALRRASPLGTYRP